MSQTFANFQLEKKLATGGMAEVYLALQTGIEGFARHVVIKRILPHLAEDPEFVQMFLNEAKIASRFNHPNIAQIYDLGEHGGTYFIAMEFIHGEDLGRLMRRGWSTGRWVPRHIALRIIADACGGLYYAHTRVDEQGRPLRVVHRDISPQNILVSFDGAVKLVDFGIAKAADQVSLTKSGAIKGKFAYMAPEQAAGKPLDGRTDIFALGLVLYELLTGQRALKRESELATLQAALECRIAPPSERAEVPSSLDEVVMRALARAPDDRYRDAREFQKAIEQYLLDSKELATSVEVSELMEELFADRLAEESRLGAPAPSTESSTNNPIAPSYQSVTQPPPRALPQPPPQPPPKPAPGETLDEGALGVDAEDDEEATIGPEGEYSLPAGTVVPSRSYMKGATRVARSPSRVDVPRPRPEPAETFDSEDEHEPEPEPPPPSRPSRSLRRRTGVAQAAEDPPEPPRRRTTGQLRRRPSSGAGMPEAPPRRTRSHPDAPARPSGDGLSKLVDVRALKRKQGARLKTVGVLLTLLAAGVLAFVFREPLLAALRGSGIAEDGVPVRLSVTTNPPTQVTVVPPRSVRNRQPIDLGRTPINQLSGAFVGDTVLLSNPDRGIRYEEVIEYGQPNEEKMIDKVFKESAVQIRTRPPLRAATIWRGATRLGQVNMRFALFPGIHSLEVHSDQLSEPVPFELRINDGQRSVEQEVDVRAGLTGKAPADD